MPANVSPQRPKGLSARGAALIVVLSCLAAYANSFAGQFVFDDIHEIERNPAIRSLLQPWNAMFVGHTMPSRPLFYLTFAVNYWASGRDPVSYHVVNLLIHVIASLALFDLALSSLTSPRLRDQFGQRAVPMALVIAAVWACHPLQTQAVTYVYQRIESMAGMFTLVSLACFARAAFGGWKPMWLAGCIAAAIGGMASKESAVVIPLLVLAYDWCCVADASSDLRGRYRFYFALAATWLVLGGVLLSQAGRYQEFAGSTHSPIAYALTQGEVILHYLRPVFWPVGQCIDYEWPIQRSWGRIVPAVGSVFAALCVTAYGLWKKRPWAWPATLFFLALAPTSSVLPVEAVANEHRMYIPLAGVVWLVVTIFVNTFADKRSPVDRTAWRMLVPASVVILALMTATHLRNQMYHSRIGMWVQIFQQDTTNWRANYNMACRSLYAGEPDVAFEFADHAVAKNPRSDVFNELAQDLNAAGDFVTAERFARRAFQIRTETLGAKDRDTLKSAADLIAALRNKGDAAAAAALAATSIGVMRRELGADHDTTLLVTAVIAATVAESGNAAEGERLAREVLALSSDTPDNRQHIRLLATAALATALESQGRYSEAVKTYGKLVELAPNNPTFFNNYAVVLYKTGNRQDAVRQFRRALE